MSHLGLFQNVPVFGSFHRVFCRLRLFLSAFKFCNRDSGMPILSSSLRVTITLDRYYDVVVVRLLLD
jgi:hypothetical protein